jgi:hypothetical protein
MDNYHCLICDKPITPKVYYDSLTYSGVPLCFPHRRMIDESRASPCTMKLYFALRENKLPVELEFKDGVKTIDIALPDLLYIEVSAKSRLNADQAFTDLLKTIFPDKKNIPTLSIPDTLILDEFRFKKAVSRIIEMCIDLKQAG